MTSIDWLINELHKKQNGEGSKLSYNHMFDKAKEMHKQECIEFYVKGCEDTYGMDEGTDDKKDAEVYYNETFKKDKL